SDPSNAGTKHPVASLREQNPHVPNAQPTSPRLTKFDFQRSPNLNSVNQLIENILF
ncbi:MAG: hypothetical protein ACI9ZM_002568, partial [Paracoccaceae bacterium]